MTPNEEELRQKLALLAQEHRDLDTAIAALLLDPQCDQFKVSRLKKRKLLLRDMISRIQSLLIPDLNA